MNQEKFKDVVNDLNLESDIELDDGEIETGLFTKDVKETFSEVDRELKASIELLNDAICKLSRAMESPISEDTEEETGNVKNLERKAEVFGKLADIKNKTLIQRIDLLKKRKDLLDIKNDSVESGDTPGLSVTQIKDRIEKKKKKENMDLF